MGKYLPWHFIALTDQTDKSLTMTMVQCGTTILKVKVVDIGNLIVTTRLRSYLKSVCCNLTIDVQFDYVPN